MNIQSIWFGVAYYILVLIYYILYKECAYILVYAYVLAHAMIVPMYVCMPITLRNVNYGTLRTHICVSG